MVLVSFFIVTHFGHNIILFLIKREIMAEFSPDDVRVYLTFIWARSRLPLTVDQFEHKMKIVGLRRLD